MRFVSAFITHSLQVIVLAFATGAGHADDHLARSWNKKDGLPQTSVLAVEQSETGYLWIGTRGGLSRFDGASFTNYGLRDGLEGLDVVALQDDGAGGLWIATLGGGISRLEDGVLTSVTKKDGLAGNYVSTLAPGLKGGVWAGGRGGLQHWDGSAFRTIDDLPKDEIFDLAGGGDALWILTRANGLYFWDGRALRSVAGETDGGNIQGHCLLLDSVGRLWVGIGNHRVMCLVDGKWKMYGRDQGLPLSFVYKMVEGFDGEIWAATHEQGVYVLTGEKFQAVSGVDSSARALCRGHQGIIWAGTQTGGLTRITKSQIRTDPRPDQAPGGQFNSIVEEPGGRMWVTSYGGGLFSGKFGNLQKVRSPEIDSAPFFLSAIRLQDESLVFGGLTILRKKRGLDEFVNVSAGGIICTALTAEKSGGFWAGFRNGELKRFSEDKEVPVENGHFPSAVSGIIEGEEENLWISTRGSGVFLWRNGVVESWNRNDGLPSDVTGALHLDDDGTLWIGTAGGGLAWLKDGRISSLGADSGLGIDFILQILEDHAGKLWLGTYQGIVRVDKQDCFDLAGGVDGNIHVLRLNESDGMRGDECTGGYAPAGMRSKSGLLYFSTVQGVNEIAPDKFGEELPPADVLIEAVRLNGTRLSAPDGTISLPAGAKELEIEFTAFEFRNPEQIRFRYRLSPANDEWVSAGKSRRLKFPMLAPGTHELRVEASNASGAWGVKSASLLFEVDSYYWQKGWFRGIAAALTALAGCAVAIIFARRRIRGAETREREALADKEAELHKNEVARLTRLATLGEISATIAHELNQPLAAIMSNAQAAQRILKKEGGDLTEVEEILHDIVSDDRRAGNVIERIRAVMKKKPYNAGKLDVGQLINGRGAVDG